MRGYNRIPIRDYDVFRLYRAGYTQAELAREFGVSESAIYMALKRQKAKYVTRKPEKVTA